MDRRILLVLLLATAALAGCSSDKSTAELVVKSQPVEVHSVPVEGKGTVGAATNTTTAAPNVPVNAPAAKSLGHIAGVVVDQAIRPLAGAKLRIPGLDLTHETDRDGAFAFVDLYPGPYFITANLTGYESAQTIVQVEGDVMVRVKFVLNLVPPPTPYHTTEKFQGFADFTTDPASSIVFGQSFTCGGCTFKSFRAADLQAMVLEATMDEYQYSGTVPGSGNSFDYSVYDDGPCCNGVSGQGPNPLRALVPVDSLTTGQLTIEVDPAAFPLPESSKEFEVFVTSWFHSDPPPDWSIVNGDE